MTSEAVTASVGDYYSAAQLRHDRWTALKHTARRLALAAKDGSEQQKLKREALGLLGVIEPIEIYWAFPGRVQFEHLRKLVEIGALHEFDHAVRRVVGSLSSGAYRRQAAAADVDGAEADMADADEGAAETGASKPYFEVLFVDTLGSGQESALKTSLHRMRRPEDPFIYESVVAPSLEDALIAVLFNHNIQAVVVRFGFDLKSESSLKVLHRYLTRLGDEDLEAFEPDEYGPELCRLLRKVRPELDVYLVTDRSVEDIAGRDLGNCRRVFYNTEDYTELHLNILRGVANRYQTPFFTALKEYSRQPTGVFHALPISRGKSIARSHWIQDMGEF